MNKSSTDDLVDYLDERFNRLNIVRLIREKFLYGKKNETLYIIENYDN